MKDVNKNGEWEQKRKDKIKSQGESRPRQPAGSKLIMRANWMVLTVVMPKTKPGRHSSRTGVMKLVIKMRQRLIG